MITYVCMIRIHACMCSCMSAYAYVCRVCRCLISMSTSTSVENPSHKHVTNHVSMYAQLAGARLTIQRKRKQKCADACFIFLYLHIFAYFAAADARGCETTCSCSPCMLNRFASAHGVLRTCCMHAAMRCACHAHACKCIKM